MEESRLEDLVRKTSLELMAVLMRKSDDREATIRKIKWNLNEWRDERDIAQNKVDAFTTAIKVHEAILQMFDAD